MVNSYQFGSVEIDGKTYDHDLIYYQGDIQRWWRQKGHKVKIADVRTLLDSQPDTVVIGTGSMGFMRVGKKALTALKQAGTEVIADRTD
jgi:hypothetical protein